MLGPLALFGALGMIFARNAVHSALFLVLTMLSLGVLYMVQQAPFLGFVQIIVYTGAIMMLFLFVLMLVGRDSSDSVVEVLRGQRLFATILGIGLAGWWSPRSPGRSPRSPRSACRAPRPTAAPATSRTSAGRSSPTTCSRSSSPRRC